MFDWRVLLAIAALGAVSYALRATGFLAAGAMPQNGWVARFLQKAPGNLFIAFVASACFESGWPGIVGCGLGLAVMAATRKEWAALMAGFGAAAVIALVR